MNTNEILAKAIAYQLSEELNNVLTKSDSVEEIVAGLFKFSNDVIVKSLLALKGMGVNDDALVNVLDEFKNILEMDKDFILKFDVSSIVSKDSDNNVKVDWDQFLKDLNNNK